MEHGIVPRFRICPPAHCAPSIQGSPVSAEARVELERHFRDQELRRAERARRNWGNPTIVAPAKEGD